MVAQASRSGLARLERPLYSFAEADRIANLTRGTTKRWLAGYQYRDRLGARVALPPVTGRGPKAAVEGVSFLDLVELVAIGGLKREGFNLPKIRQVVDYCQKELHTAYPLASLKFKVGGRDVFVERGGHLLDVLRRKGGQAWSEVLEPFLETLDYGEAFANRWWPLGKERAVVVDPEYGFGLPALAHSGVRTDIIFERFQAGDPPEQIAQDFNLAADAVEQALEFESTRIAA